ncbi:MAG TPA: FecR family protein [Pyrinomonadaceae bacterium]|nr:FecR family protein [Pyrinomonadaceae bacterium]
MRKTSTSVSILFCAIVVLISGVAVFAQKEATRGQTRDRFIISARAGGVNAVTGKTGVHSKGSSDWEQLTIKDNLEGGDVVKTGLDGRVEILLNPGSYMRVGENSEFELTSNSLDNLEVHVIRGTAIVEATGAEDTELLINITTPHAKMAIVRRGLYRVNVVPGDVTEVIVRKGRLLLSDPDAKIKAGKKLIFSGNSYSVAALTDAEKKDVDSLDLWSKDRSQVVAKANQALTSRDRRILRSGFSSDWAFRFSPRIGGIWFLDTAFGFYSFMPFYAGWGSPYGRSYPFSFYSGYWWQIRNSYWPTQRGYFPDFGTTGSGIGGKSIPTVTPGTGSTSRGSFPKGSGGGKQLP